MFPTGTLLLRIAASPFLSVSISMNKNIVRAAALGALSLLAACGDGGAGGGVVTPAETGDMQLTLSRAVNSTIPAGTDSAVVRIWNTAARVDAAKAVAIPAPGSTTQVQFNLPATSGYSVGVIAFKRDPAAGRQGTAAGVTTGVTILANQANAATVNVKPVEGTLTTAESAASGTSSSVALTLTDASLLSQDMLGYSVALRMRATPWLSDWEYVPSAAMSLVGTEFRSSIQIPTLEGDSAVYLQAQLYTATGWEAGGPRPLFFLPSLSRGQALTRLPVHPASGSITISFDKANR